MSDLLAFKLRCMQYELDCMLLKSGCRYWSLLLSCCTFHDCLTVHVTRCPCVSASLQTVLSMVHVSWVRSLM